MRMIQTKPNCCSVQYFSPSVIMLKFAQHIFFLWKIGFPMGTFSRSICWRWQMLTFPFSPFYTALCLFICLLKELGTEQAKSHWLHLFHFSPLCVFKYLLKSLTSTGVLKNLEHKLRNELWARRQTSILAESKLFELFRCGNEKMLKIFFHKKLIPRNLLKETNIQARSMWKLTSRAFRKCGTYWPL